MSLPQSELTTSGRLHFAEGGREADLGVDRSAELVRSMLESLGPLRRVLLVPPDFTRFHSGAGQLTTLVYEQLAGRCRVEVLPALGTHTPMKPAQIAEMFPNIPAERFHVHDWRSKVLELGEVPAAFVRSVSGGRLEYAIRCEVARLLVEGGWDRIVSIGQLVPHEVIGIAGHDKNVFVGAGGKDVIDRTHYLGAVCGMESIMGRPYTPVRSVISYMARELGKELPVTHLMTVRERDASGVLRTRGLFSGEGDACFAAGAALAQACNVELLEQPLSRVVVYLDPSEYQSTWLGNKAIYRTRMAIADGGELLILAPGVRKFGEDPRIDGLIRRHGYRNTQQTLASVALDPELSETLSAAAHLIHGSSEGRFRIVYAAGGLSREEVEGVGYEYRELPLAMNEYDPVRLSDGYGTVNGKEVFFVRNPALGLWALRSRFETAPV